MYPLVAFGWCIIAGESILTSNNQQ